VTGGDLKRYGLLAEFTDDERDALAELLEEQHIFQGRAVFREGEEADGLVLLASGTLRVEREGVDNLSLLDEGSVIGGISLLVLTKRVCSVLAETECDILRLRRQAYRRLVDDAPRSACRLAESVVREFAECLTERLDDVVEVLGDSA
jgi:CRP-like cAMP-binding protein